MLKTVVFTLEIRLSLHRIAIKFLLCHLFIHIRPILGFFLLYILTMNSSNNGNHWRTLAFKKLKRLLHKYYARFSKICKNTAAQLNQFFVLLYGCVPNLKRFLSIEKFFVKIWLLLYIVKPPNLKIVLIRQRL